VLRVTKDPADSVSDLPGVLLSPSDDYVQGEIAVLRKQFDGGLVEHQEVGVGERDEALADRSWLGLPTQGAIIGVQRDVVDELGGILHGSDHAAGGEVLLTSLAQMDLLQGEQEVPSVTGLNHCPVQGTLQIHVGGQKDDVVALHGDDVLVGADQVLVHIPQRTLPAALVIRIGAEVGTTVAVLLVTALVRI